MNEEKSKNTIWTPANVVTIIRILGVPLFVVALLSPWPQWFPQFPVLETWKPWVAVIIFVILACTDSLDGYLARSRNEVTTFGKFVDPLADKILVAAALLVMIELRIIPSWVALIILAREFIVSGLRMIAASEGEVIAASWYGKAKTVTQIIAIILFLVKDICLGEAQNPETLLYIVSWAFMIVALVLTILSMVDYFVKCMPMLGLSERQVESEEQNKTLSETAKSESAPSDTELCELATKVITAAKEKNVTLGTAESLTGGMISQYLTSVPGSSSVVMGAVVSYAYDVKEHLLGVPRETLSSDGAVCAEVAEQMARGARDKTEAQYTVSVTGIAGPGGEEPGKPVGTVWMGMSKESETVSRVFHFSGTRDDVRRFTTKAALDAFIALINQD